MPVSSESSPAEVPANDLARHIRRTLGQLEHVDRDTAGYLNSLAFILQRVAGADDEISDDEVDRMEKILIEHAEITAPQAVLTVEIAKHRWQLADCCCSYRSSRELRERLDPRSRKQLQGFLRSVANADGVVHPSEQAEIRQISAELGMI